MPSEKWIAFERRYILPLVWAGATYLIFSTLDLLVRAEPENPKHWLVVAVFSWMVVYGTHYCRFVAMSRWRALMVAPYAVLGVLALGVFWFILARYRNWESLEWFDVPAGVLLTPHLFYKAARTLLFVISPPSRMIEGPSEPTGAEGAEAPEEREGSWSFFPENWTVFLP